MKLLRGKNYDKAVENLILFKRSLTYQTKEFFHNSTLHGVRYIAEKGRPSVEKFMWFCFVTIGLVTALVIIVSLWGKFQTNPTITGLDTDFYNQNVIFPTTAVCPFESYDKEKAHNLSYNHLANYDEGETNRMVVLLKLLPNINFENLQTAIQLRNEVNGKINNRSLRQLVFQISIKCENVLIRCQYRGEEFECCKQFLPIYTENGYCFAFNSRFTSLPDSDETTGEPLHLYETDKKWALFFTPNASVQIYILPNEEYFGKEFSPKVTWKEGEITEVRISKRNTYTTDDARQLSISQRKCIFHDEVKLMYFPYYYTYTSCMKECRMKKAVKLCKCLPPFYKPIENIPMCTLNEFDCLDLYKNNITSNLGCYHCELSCSKTVYNLEKIIKSGEGHDIPGVSIEFLTWPIIRYRREVLFGWVDLLVSFGGIASLFLGFSLLSGVEIIYYFTLRACCMLWKNRQELYEIEERIKAEPPHPINMNLWIRIYDKQNVHQTDHQHSAALSKASGGSEKPPNYMEAIAIRRRGEKDYTKHSQSMFRKPKVLPSFSEIDNNPTWQYDYLP